MSVRTLLPILIVAVLFAPAHTAPQSSVSRILGGHTVTYTFDKAYETGTFINGDWWVVGPVTITDITPAGGAMVNPDRNDAHGLLDKWPNYDSTLDITTQLPYVVEPKASVVKAVTRGSCLGWGPRQYDQCTGVLDILTVLDAVPPDNGSTVFRPPYVGTAKPLRSINSVRFDRLPAIPEISAHASQESFSAITAQWSAPTLDIIRWGAGEIYRGLSPMDVYEGRDYAADIAAKYLNKLMSVFGTEPVDSAKKAAVYALMQPGLDNYEAYKAGYGFSSGAGQHLGKKPEIVFAAAMYDDPEMVSTVRAASADPWGGWFQEDKQVYTTKNSTTPVWGDMDSLTSEKEYWLRFGYDGEDNTKSEGDPYGYIDGPAHGIHGSNYQEVTSGPYMSFAMVQHLMPWMEYANNDWELLEYVDRMWDGRGFDDFDGGWWGSPDPCAAKTDGAVQGVDYGADPANPGDCIKDGVGRFVADHDTVRGFGRKSWIVEAVWPLYRDCVDPGHPSYPCAGMGPEVEDNGIFDLLSRRVKERTQPLRVYPNPSTGYITLSGAADVFLIYDHAGRLVRTVKNRMAFLPPGVYLVTDEARTDVERVVILK